MSLKNVAVISAVLAVLAGVGTPLSAQHTGHTMPGKTDTTKKKPTAKPKPKVSKTPVKKAGSDTARLRQPAADSSMTGMPGMAQVSTAPEKGRVHGRHDMTSGPLSIPMDRMGSGTTWIPDAVSLPSRHGMFGGWEVMAHGFLFGQYDHQSGRRGDDQLGSLNWTMLMVSRELAGGHFQARTMLSLDPWTVTPEGYPLLLQTGETFDGEPLYDRQHPHDAFMELAVLYQREFTNRIAWSLYAAPSGEPALGPVAFMHRTSAMDNPAAPLSHHWQDATHVSFGVITAGIFTRSWQLEASVFNGREPDQHRWNFDPIKLDSYSGRITTNPNGNWSLSAGYGYLKSPEVLHADESTHRLTASALHGRKVGVNGQMSSALIWGANRHSAGSKATHSFLVENETLLDSRNTVFGRAELVQKTGEDLVLGENTPAIFPVDDLSEERFNVGSLQLGYIRELTRLRWATLGVGGGATLNFVPRSLEETYGSRHPIGTFIFLRIRPFHKRSAAMSGMNETTGGSTSHEHE